MEGFKHRLLTPELFEVFAHVCQEQCATQARSTEAVPADPELGAGASEATRSLIARIVPTPRVARGGTDALLEGDLARILAIGEAAHGRQARRASGGPVPVVGDCGGRI